MASSDVQIANLALAACGSRSSIVAFNEGSVEADAVNAQYAARRDELLRAHHWDFSRKQVSLTLFRDATKTPTPDPVPTPWLYEYLYPSDCLLARYIMPQLQASPFAGPGPSVPQWTGAPIRFVVSNDDDNSNNPITVLLTNQVQAILVYTRAITNPALFDTMFTTALAHYLGAHLSIPLSGDKALAKANFNIADSLVQRARAMSANEGLTVVDSMPDWIKVRGYQSDWAFPDGSFWQCSPQNLIPIT